MLLDRLAALVPLSDAQSKDYGNIRADFEGTIIAGSMA